MNDINLKDKKKWIHPTIKPLNIVRTLIRNSSEENELVFDGFLGSGTTRVASFVENRDFLGCELMKDYYELQERRYQDECLRNKIVEVNGAKVIQKQLFE